MPDRLAGAGGGVAWALTNPQSKSADSKRTKHLIGAHLRHRRRDAFQPAAAEARIIERTALYATLPAQPDTCLRNASESRAALNTPAPCSFRGVSPVSDEVTDRALPRYACRMQPYGFAPAQAFIRDIGPRRCIYVPLDAGRRCQGKITREAPSPYLRQDPAASLPGRVAPAACGRRMPHATFRIDIFPTSSNEISIIPSIIELRGTRRGMVGNRLRVARTDPCS
jgi:hypothetical protein